MPWAERVAFFVPGDPATKGSPQVGGKPGGRRWIAPDSKHLEAWDELVRMCALPHRLNPPLEGPVSLGLLFTLRRPKNHYRADGSLSAIVPAWPTAVLDLDKAARAVGDSISGKKKRGQEHVGILLRRDSQIVNYHQLQKRYAVTGEAVGCRISICTPEV